MKITKIQVTISRTHNIGNYESIRVEAGAHADLEDGDDIKASYEKLKAQARNELAQMEQEERLYMNDSDQSTAEDYF